MVLNLCREANLADEALWPVLRKMEEVNSRVNTIAYNSRRLLF